MASAAILLLTAVCAAAPIEEEPLGDLLDLLDDQVDTSTSVADRVARSQREALPS